MFTLNGLGVAAMVGGAFGVSVLTAVLPWLNAEVLLLAALPTARSLGVVAPLVCATTAGQMVGKSLMFWSSRRATRQVAPVDGAPQRRGAAAVARWRDRFERHPRAVLATVLVSAVVGLPPFYVVSVAAGAMGLQFRRFVFVGTLGRLLHFAAVAWMGR